jgi:hypothetical protein
LNKDGKAKSFDHLAGFYEACATVEIDEYRDYEKVKKNKLKKLKIVYLFI